MISLLIMLAVCYLVGSLPTAIVYGKLTRRVDIREHGSGNAGATNVFRVFGWKAGLVVLMVDVLKGLVSTLVLYRIALNGISLDPILLQIFAGMSAVFGHIWTVFANFKGGKGVGTGAGMIIGLVPGAVLAGLVIFVLTVAATRYVSLGSMLASLTIPAYLFIKSYIFHYPVPISLFIFGLFIPVLILFTHRSNITRLLKGTENKIKFRKS